MNYVLGLPTAPINVQYVGAFNPANSMNGPSVVIKTAGNMTGPSGTNIQLQTPNVEQRRVHSGSPLHQNVTFSSPTVMRAVGDCLIRVLNSINSKRTPTAAISFRMVANYS